MVNRSFDPQFVVRASDFQEGIAHDGVRRGTLAIQALVEDTDPDPDTDFVVTFDDSAGVHKKVAIATLIALAGTGGGPEGGAPTDADYLVKTAHVGLSDERVVTDTGSIVWDWTTAGQAKAALAAIATARILGNVSGSSAIPSALSASDVKTMLAIAAGDVSGLAAIATSGSANDLASGTMPTGRLPSLTGHVALPSGTNVTEIQASVVANSMLVNMAAGTLKGNNTGSPAAPTDISAADVRTMLGLVIGTNVQAYAANLTALAGLTSAADKVPYFTGSGSAGVADLTSVARTLIAQTTQALMRTTGLGCGTAATLTTDTDGGLVAASDSNVATQKATKTYVDLLRSYVDSQDTAVAGLGLMYTDGKAWKASVRAISTTDITLSGAQTIDGVSIGAGDRVCVAGQAAAANNGIYLCQTGAWTREPDGDSSADMVRATFLVREGTVNANTVWTCVTNAITLGSTSLVFSQIAGSIATARMWGNVSGATALPIALTQAQVRTFLGLATVATSGSASDLGTGTLPAGAFPALAGDVTTTAGSLTTAIGAGKVTATALATSAVDVSSTKCTGTLAAGRFPALTGDVTTTAGSLATAIGVKKVTAAMMADSAVDLSATSCTGTLAAARFPALAGDVTTTAGSLTTAIGARKVLGSMLGNCVAASFNQSIANSNTELLLINYSTTCAAKDGFELFACGYFVTNNTGGSTIDFRIKIGGTTYVQISYGTVQASTKYPWELRAYIGNTGATNRQTVHGSLMIFANGSISGPTQTVGQVNSFGFGILSAGFMNDPASYPNKDWTSAQAIVFSIQHGTADANSQHQIDVARLTALPAGV